MKKKIIAVILTMMMAVLATACGSVKLAEIYDEETVEQDAMQVLTEWHDGDYDAMVERFTDELKELVPADTLQTAADSYLPEAGAFQEYESVSVIGQKNQTTGEDNAVVVVVATYENKKIVYTVSFDPRMQLNGFRLQ